MKKTFLIALIICCFSFYANAQTTIQYNIAELLNSNMLVTDTSNYYPWNKLRKEHPLVYDNSINPAPKADKWFHARIIVKDD